MKILAFEFSSSLRSVALVQQGPVGPVGVPVTGRRTGESTLRPLALSSSPAGLSVHEAVETGGRQIRALAMVSQVLTEAGVRREEVGCIAVGIGPGSYMGIRAAISLAQGWQLATGVRLLGVDAVQCLAAEACDAGLKGLVAVIIDAQRGEFYHAAYQIDGHGWRVHTPLAILTRSELDERLTGGVVPIGPEVNRWFPQGRVLYPSAGRVGRLALGRSDYTPGEALEPVYLRETTFVKMPPPRPMPA